jgi:hypothetical protein
VVCDSAYAASATLDDRPAKVHVISRLRMDAALWRCRPHGSGKRVSLGYHRWLTKTTEEEAQTHVEEYHRRSATRPPTRR